MIEKDPKGPGDTLNTEEAAEFLKYNVQTVRRLASEKKIPGHKLGSGKRGNWLFFRSDLENYVRGLSPCLCPNALAAGRSFACKRCWEQQKEDKTK